MPDVLSQILDHLKLKGSIYFHTDFHRPWGIKVPAHSNVIRFHMAMQGGCCFRIDGKDEPVVLSPKDLIIIPHGVSHDIVDHEQTQAVEIEELVSASGFAPNGALRAGDGEDLRSCKLICGHFSFEEGVVHPLLGALPNFLLLRSGEDVDALWFESAMRFMSSEILSGQPGSDAVVHRLAEIILIHVIRNFVKNAGDEAGVLAAVLDPKISACLSGIHQSPAEPWTVAKLAFETGMSRTVFADRFRNLMGMTPLEYVTSWRMQIAKRHLVDGELPLAHIANEVGYGSEAAFSRAFKREFDQTPGQVRRGSK